ncbi:MAG TPA: type II toxin-antitoxin system VapC family toxin [Candidatus Hydrogenedentes bacterium]|nr:type II toxin-antitoxin system VapC family toxin [Candidatus Hydrogenedentota bacterium]
MIFDTDVIIWALRGNARAAAAMDDAEHLEISVISYMELVQGARDHKDLRMTRAFLADTGFHMLPLTEAIGHRAAVYLEEYALKSRLGIPDALIAATAAENRLVLCSGNVKHYRAIADIELRAFRP